MLSFVFFVVFLPPVKYLNVSKALRCCYNTFSNLQWALHKDTAARKKQINKYNFVHIAHMNHPHQKIHSQQNTPLEKHTNKWELRGKMMNDFNSLIYYFVSDFQILTTQTWALELNFCCVFLFVCFFVS